MEPYEVAEKLEGYVRALLRPLFPRVAVHAKPDTDLGRNASSTAPRDGACYRLVLRNTDTDTPSAHLVGKRGRMVKAVETLSRAYVRSLGRRTAAPVFVTVEAWEDEVDDGPPPRRPPDVVRRR